MAKERQDPEGILMRGLRWGGNTEQQRREARQRWHKRFAWLPVQMDDGTWIWLGAYAERAEPANYNDRWILYRSLLIDGWKLPPMPEPRKRPPPAKPQ